MTVGEYKVHMVMGIFSVEVSNMMENIWMSVKGRVTDLTLVRIQCTLQLHEVRLLIEMWVSSRLCHDGTSAL